MAIIRVGDWWDVFTFDMGEPRLLCPDCDTPSPEFDNIFQAVEWVEAHILLCPAVISKE